MGRLPSSWSNGRATGNSSGASTTQCRRFEAAIEDIFQPSALAAFKYRRDQPFSYVCNRCKKCCHAKAIPLSPYDLVRLAEVCGCSTGELIEKYTIDGALLKSVPEDETHPCVFLGPEGCNVHAGRPAACRVYPLGRSSNLSGEESFVILEPHPESTGTYGEEGTIGDYVDGQGLAPYIAASRRYLELWHRLAHSGVMDEEIKSEGEEGFHPYDVDAVVARYCAEKGLEFPTSVDAKVELHIAAIEAMLPG